MVVPFVVYELLASSATCGPTIYINSEVLGDWARRGGKPSGPRASGLYGLVDSAGDRLIDHAPTGGDARGVFVNDALINHRAFVSGGIPRANRGVVRHLHPRKRGIDLRPALGLTGLSLYAPELSCMDWGVVID